MLTTFKSIAYRLLANRTFRRTYEAANRLLLTVASSNRVAAYLFGLIAPLAMSREHYAMLAGRAAYYRNLTADPVVTSVQLRRNIHRLEKGLLMRPPRSSFAADYIGETIEFFEAATQTGVDSDELAWASDVLESYFERVDRTTVIDALRRRFESATPISLDAQTTRRAPYPRSASPEISVSYEDLLQLAVRRRSVRWFAPQPVERDKIDRALEIARLSPTACNRMPYDFRIFDDPAMVQQVASIPFGAAGYSDNIPVIVVVVGRLDYYFSPRDRHVPYIDGSLAAMSFMYALETQGLASSVINWPDFEPLERKMQQTLGLSVYERPLMLIALGYADPDGFVAYSEKKQLESFRTYNKMARSTMVPPASCTTDPTCE